MTLQYRQIQSTLFSTRKNTYKALKDLGSDAKCWCFEKLREKNNKKQGENKEKYLIDFDELLSNCLIIIFIFTRITTYIGVVATNNQQISLNHLENAKIKLINKLIS